MSRTTTDLLYLVTIVTFILALRFLSSPKRARQGNLVGATGMALAIAVTLAQDGLENYALIGAGMAIGGAVGVAGATLGSRALLTMAAGQLPRTSEVALDGTVLLFALAASLITGLLFGLAPALRARGTDLQASLREAGRGLVSGSGQRMRTGLVIAEVALAVVLIVGAGLMTRSFIQLLRVDLGFRPEKLLAVNFTINTTRHGGPAWRLVYREMIDRVRTVPGLVSVAAVKHAPFRGNGERVGFRPEGLTLGAGDRRPRRRSSMSATATSPRSVRGCSRAASIRCRTVPSPLQRQELHRCSPARRPSS